MTLGRVLGSVTASIAVAGCAIVVVGIGRADSRSSAQTGKRVPVAATPSARPAFLPGTTSRVAASTHPASAASSHPATRTSTTPAATTYTPPVATQPSYTAPTYTPPVHTPPASTAPRTTVTTSQRTSAAPVARPRTKRTTPSSAAQRPRTAVRPTTVRRTTVRRTATHPRTAPVTRQASPTLTRGGALPLGYATGGARKVITVVAHSHGSTTATLQAWSRAGGGGWFKHGSPVTAHVGSDGLSSHASESKSATPIGSFTLTRAFGHDSNPGTSLPYLHTTPAAWWISEPGKLYNTLQVCSSHCGFHQGSPNEHLYYETPYYDYAVVIDYNTRNAPGGVHQGAGSAFFLHVTDGHPTAGCVSIPMSKLTSIMRWLTPQSHARILIGVRG